MSTALDTAGGNLRAAVNLAESLVVGGADVTFSAPVVPGEPHRTVDLMDPRIERRLFPASRPVARFGGSLRQAWWLWRNARTFDEVQNHSVFTLSAVYVAVACAVRGVPVLLWPHGSIDPFDLRKHRRAKSLLGPIVTRPLLNRSAALLFTTTQEAETAVTYGSRTPREVVPLPVAPLQSDHVDAAQWRARHGIPADAPMVLFLGRIDYKKRLPLLVEAVSLMDRRDVQLVVVGAGSDDERALVWDAAERGAMTDRLHLTGWLEGVDRVEAFFAADVFALLSDAENFGLSVVEALSVGCPVVISDQVHLAEHLERAGAAIRVTRDARQAADALNRLLADPAEAAAMGERGRALVEREFAPAAVAARLAAVSADAP